MLKLKYRDFFLIKEKFMLGKKIFKKKRRIENSYTSIL